jgi:hypothetical protein
MPKAARLPFTALGAAVLLLSAVCLGLGTAIGLLWAFSEPGHAPHGGLYLGLPGGVLVLQGVAMAIAGTMIRRKWQAYRLAAPALIGFLPVLGLVYPAGLLFAGMVGLAPFTVLAKLLAA